jgi:asparagine synthase (glutamine-hydrolysing)
MCGVSGVWLREAGDEERIVREMTRPLRRRGPDAEGTMTFPAHALAFGHARLAVVDTSLGGAQPFASASGRTVMVFNGEIYNHRELRRLLGEGFRWRTSCDTETLVELIEAIGFVETLRRCVGMFAIGCFRFDTKELLLGRDPFGEKPLFYAVDAIGIAFASQTSALDQTGWSQGLDERSLIQFIARGWTDPRSSVFSGVRPVPPGGVVRWTDAGANAEVTTWIPVAGGGETFADTPLGLASSVVERALRRAVALQLQADVNVGCFLSGGIDSSLIAVLMAETLGRRLDTFSVEAETSGDYAPIAPVARTIAAHISAKHHHLVVTHLDAASAFASLCDVFDEPHGDASALPMILLSRFARESVTVALSGDGADELFGGYNRLRAARVRDSLQQIGAALPFLPRSGFLARRATGLLRDNSHARRLRAVVAAQDASAAYLMAASPTAALHRTSLSLNNEDSDAMSCMARFVHEDVKSYLPGNILVKLDRSAMFSSLETRCPFLDPGVVSAAESVRSVPSLRAIESKPILRNILFRRLSPHLFAGTKLGFTLPLRSWLCREPMRSMVGDLLRSSAVVPLMREVFDSDAVSRHLDLHSDQLDERAAFTVASLSGWLSARRSARGAK